MIIPDISEYENMEDRSIACCEMESEFATEGAIYGILLNRGEYHNNRQFLVLSSTRTFLDNCLNIPTYIVQHS